MTGQRSNKQFLFLVVFALGLIVVALPDSGKRIFSLSKEHGPSLQDVAGIALMLIAYSWFVQKAWKQRSKISWRKNIILTSFLMVLVIACIIGLIFTIGYDHGNWWLVPAFILATIQGILFFIILK